MTYSDPHRKGYAELLSGDYRNAAKTLGQLHDGQASYNLGNALAHTGDLEGALKAFENALKQNPGDRDARHNRDLVADALKRQSQSGGSRKEEQKGASGEKPGDQKGDQKEDQKGNKKGDRKEDGQKHDAKRSEKSQAGHEQPGNPAAHGEPESGRPVDESRSMSEQQIEKEQWLHSIPDDPGGLLRRKFLIEHMMRQQER